jgi:phenylacetate-CoA ligase
VQSLVPRLKSLSFSLPLIRRNPLFYGRASRLLEEFESWDPDRQRAWREARLARMLAAAGETAYGRRLGAPRSLEEWPVLYKDAIRDAPHDFVAGRRRFAVPAATSGTTGTPLRLKRSWSSIVYEQAVIDRMMALGGASPRRARVAVLRGDDIKAPDDRSPPFWRFVGANQLVFSSHHLNRHTVGHFTAAAREFAPDVLFAYPSALESLCALMLAQGFELRIPLTLCGSEVLTRATMQAARLALSTRIIGYYGQAERVAWADGDPADGYRFLGSYSVNELQFVESVDDADAYELIGTSLWNEAMPLVRYHTGDRFLLAKGSDPEAVAAGRAPLAGIVGRQGDYLVSPDGGRLIGINHIPRGVPQLLRAQFVQESPERVRVLVMTTSDFDESCRRTLLEHAARKLPSSMQISIEVTDQLVRTASGKTPLVLRPFESDDAGTGGAA